MSVATGIVLHFCDDDELLNTRIAGKATDDFGCNCYEMIAARGETWRLYNAGRPKVTKS